MPFSFFFSSLRIISIVAPCLHLHSCNKKFHSPVLPPNHWPSPRIRTSRDNSSFTSLSISSRLFFSGRRLPETNLLQFGAATGSGLRSNSSQMGPDWSLLPPDLVRLLSEKILFINQYYRFRAVCRSWRRASSPRPDHIPQIPWLKLPRDRERLPNICTFSFYDFPKSKNLQIELSYCNGKTIVGSSRSWLVLEQDRQVSLINPITRDIKSDLFPSLDTPPTVLGFAITEKTQNPLPPVHYKGFKQCIKKVILTRSPTDEDCIMVASFYSEWELGFCGVGDNCWTLLRLKEYGRGNRTMQDFRYQNGSIYAIDNKGHLSVYSLGDLSHETFPANLVYRNIRDRLYLVAGEGENGPLAVRHVDYGTVQDKFEVFECYTDVCRRHRWRRVRDVGNYVLLLDEKHCQLVSCDDINLNGWQRNQIYYCIRKSCLNWSYHVGIKMVCIQEETAVEVAGVDGITLSSNTASPCWFTARLY